MFSTIFVRFLTSAQSSLLVLQYTVGATAVEVTRANQFKEQWIPGIQNQNTAEQQSHTEA
jgi:hypothetical protein